MRGEEQTMKTSTFNRIFENARSVNIQSNEWFNYAGFFWMQCTEKHLADSIRLLSAGEDPTTWAEEVAVHAATLAQVTASLTALRKVAHDSEILMEREEKA